jgi:hypothetical protein
MPSEIEIYGDIVLFGICIAFRANDRRALDVALNLYPEWINGTAQPEAASIYVVLTAYNVNPTGADLHHVEGRHLAITRSGISVTADGGTGKGACTFARGFDADELADLANTMVLFLVGHADRVPLHASAVMLGETAIVFAGPSGAGKSTLALAASRAGLPLLSDDTIFVQTRPTFRLWSLAGPIHVFQKDAPSEAEGGMRLRGGRWKRALAAQRRRHWADRAILCVLDREETASLTSLPSDAAIAALTHNPEAGYQFYGEAADQAARALAGEGAWRLALSSNPAEAIALIGARFASATGLSFYGHYVALTAEIERRFAITRWRCGDADLWPLARFDLYLDMYWRNSGMQPPQPRLFPLRLAGRLLKPFVNIWRSRADLAHWRAWPKPAPVIFLGDGVSLDRIGEVYQDRQGEPLIAALEQRGAETALMQSGEMVRLPWRRPTFAANLVAAWGWLFSPLFVRRLQLPDHDLVMRFLTEKGVPAPSLRRTALKRRSSRLLAEAFLFGLLLKYVRPRFGLVVSYYAGLGPAFVLACRRQAILCADLQHAPLEGAPMAYRFAAYPDNGYSTLPALFWSWTNKDADAVRHDSHPSFAGGAPQHWTVQDGEQAFDPRFEREILVALQPIAGHRADWEALAAEIEAAPPQWRWWIRRHPASRPDQDSEFGRLLSLRLPQVVVGKASDLPLPVLLRQMNAVVSLASGVAMEAAMFHVPAFFLSEDACGPFGALIESGAAEVVGISGIRARIARLSQRHAGGECPDMPEPGAVLLQLERIVEAYAARHGSVTA